MDSLKRERLIKLGRFVKSQRILKGYSITHIEKKYGIDRALWSKLENGKLLSMPKPELLSNIAVILSVNTVKLFILAGFILEEDIMAYVIEANRVREMDHRRRTFKP